MEKKSIVRSAIFQKTVSNANGEFHIFEILFDNQDKGQYLTKTNPQTIFKEGQEIEYTIEEKINGKYTNYSIKPLRPAFVPGKGNPSYEHRRTALKCAVDLAVGSKIEVKQIPDFAGSFMKFLNADAT